MTAGVFASILTLALAWPVTQAEDRTAYPADTDLAHAEQVLALLNEARLAEGLTALSPDDGLALLAFQHAHEMAERGLVGHHSYAYGIGTRTRIKLAFPQIYQFAENVGANGDPERLHRGMMNSAGHRLNRMDPVFTHVGIGVATGRDGRLFLTEVFVRVSAPGQLALAALYPRVPQEELPQEQARTGQVLSETVVIPPPAPDDPEYWTQRGIDAYVERRYGDAVSDFQRALELDPDYRFARFDLGRALIAADRPRDAIAELDRFLTTHPEDLDAWAARGSACLLVGDWPAAERAFRKVLSGRVTDAGSWYNLGLSLEFQDLPQDAENAYAQALHLDPTLSAAAIGLQRVRR